LGRDTFRIKISLLDRFSHILTRCAELMFNIVVYLQINIFSVVLETLVLNKFFGGERKGLTNS